MYVTKRTNQEPNRQNYKRLAIPILILSAALLFTPTQVLADSQQDMQNFMNVVQDIVDKDWEDQQRRGHSGTLPMRDTRQPQAQPQQNVNCAYTANPSKCFLNQGFR